MRPVPTAPLPYFPFRLVVAFFLMKGDAPMLHGSINHISITVSDLRGALTFLSPLFDFLWPENLKFEIVHTPLAEQRFHALQNS